MKKSIGILGGMGPLATADLFQTIVNHTEAEGDGDHIHIYIDNNSQIPDRTAAILGTGADPLPPMLESIRKLEDCGAHCLIMPCNTAHYFHPALQAETALPFLHMLNLTVEACLEQFPKGTAGLLATRGTIQSGVYATALEAQGVPYISPNEAQLETLMTVIYQGVKAGKSLEPFRSAVESLLQEMADAGADYFILGCTELPLMAQQLALPQAFVNPTLELAKAAICHCGYHYKVSTQ